MNTIIHMNHSPRFQEAESQPLPRERDANQLYRELVNAYGVYEADRLAKSVSGYSYDEVCKVFIEALSDADSRTIHAQGD